MKLPTLNVPTKEIILPSTQKPIRIRPFLVKEEKLLLIAKEGGDQKEIIDALISIIGACIVSKTINVQNLQYFDFEYILLQLKMFSIGESNQIVFAPIPNTTCPECAKERIVTFNLNDAKIVTPEGHSKQIQLEDNIGIIMKYPNIKDISKLDEIKHNQNLNTLFEFIWSCVESVYTKTESIKRESCSTEEGIAFLESLTEKQFEQIEKFFDTLPRLTQNIQVKCKKCSLNETYKLVGLEDFFG